MESTPQWLTTSQVANMLGLGMTKTYELLKEELPSYRFGRVIRVHKNDIETWLEANKVVPRN